MEFIRYSSSTVNLGKFNVTGNLLSFYNRDSSGEKKIPLFDTLAEYRIEVTQWNSSSSSPLGDTFIIYCNNTTVNTDIVEFDITSNTGTVLLNSLYKLTFYIVNNKNEISNPAPHDLTSHTDVTITNPQQDEYLSFNSGTGQWENITRPIANVTASNQGGATGEVFYQKVGNDLQFKTLNPTGDISITNNVDTIDIGVTLPQDFYMGRSYSYVEPFGIPSDGEIMSDGVSTVRISKTDAGGTPYVNNDLTNGGSLTLYSQDDRSKVTNDLLSKNVVINTAPGTYVEYSNFANSINTIFANGERVLVHYERSGFKTINDMGDVQLNVPFGDKDILQFNSATLKWENAQLPASSRIGHPYQYGTSASVSAGELYIQTALGTLLFIHSTDNDGNDLSAKLDTSFLAGTILKWYSSVDSNNFLQLKIPENLTYDALNLRWSGAIEIIGSGVGPPPAGEAGHLIVQPAGASKSKQSHRYTWGNAVVPLQGQFYFDNTNVYFSALDDDANNLNTLIDQLAKFQNTIFKWFSIEDTGNYFYGKVTPEAGLTFTAGLPDYWSGAVSGAVYGSPSAGEAGILEIQIVEHQSLQDISNVDATNIDNGSHMYYNTSTQNWEMIKYNYAGTTAPTVTDDTNNNYAVGSRWYDTTNDKEYVCLDATSSNAVWKKTTKEILPELNDVDIDVLTNNPTTIGTDFSPDFILDPANLTTANPTNWPNATNGLNTTMTGASVVTSSGGIKYLQFSTSDVWTFSTPSTFTYTGGFTAVMVIGNIGYDNGSITQFFSINDQSNYLYANNDFMFYNHSTNDLVHAVTGDVDQVSGAVDLSAKLSEKWTIIGLRSNGTTIDVYVDDPSTILSTNNASDIGTRPAFQHFAFNARPDFLFERSGQIQLNSFYVWNSSLSNESFTNVFTRLNNYLNNTTMYDIATNQLLRYDGTNWVNDNIVPTGDIVGTTDTQTLSNKSLIDASTSIIDDVDNTKQLKFQTSTITTATTREYEAQDDNGRVMLSTTGESVKFDNNSGGDQLFALNGGLGNTVGDRVTYVGGSNYPFFAGQSWSNLSLVTGSCSYEDFVTPLSFDPTASYTLMPFPGTLQAGSFQVTTNGSGRLTNADGITWTFLINFSCAITGGNGTEFEIALFINGTKVSNSYITTIANNGRYSSLTGVWNQPLNGGSVGGTAVANQYCEIYIKRNVGTGNVTVGSAFLGINATRMESQPTV
jgi:hypothetical protein